MNHDSEFYEFPSRTQIGLKTIIEAIVVCFLVRFTKQSPLKMEK
jgi:hypothetical protein